MERTETQMKILEVGKREFLEKGFKDASLNRIVAEAGFTKGAFYGYYPDKAALFEDIVREAADGLVDRFKAAQDAHFDLIPEERGRKRALPCPRSICARSWNTCTPTSTSSG